MNNFYSYNALYKHREMKGVATWTHKHLHKVKVRWKTELLQLNFPFLLVYKYIFQIQVWIWRINLDDEWKPQNSHNEIFKGAVNILLLMYSELDA